MQGAAYRLSRVLYDIYACEPLRARNSLTEQHARSAQLVASNMHGVMTSCGVMHGHDSRADMDREWSQQSGRKHITFSMNNSDLLIKTYALAPAVART